MIDDKDFVRKESIENFFGNIEEKMDEQEMGSKKGEVPKKESTLERDSPKVEVIQEEEKL